MVEATTRAGISDEHCTKGTALDVHQRLDKDGDIAPDCLCSVLTPGPGEAASHGAPLQRKWAVSGAKALALELADWGSYWRQEGSEVGK
jgi:hypothetical protein